MEPLASARPWMVVTEGNHDVERLPLVVEPEPFRAYKARWRMPHDVVAGAGAASPSPSP